MTSIFMHSYWVDPWSRGAINKAHIITHEGLHQRICSSQLCSNSQRQVLKEVLPVGAGVALLHHLPLPHPLPLAPLLSLPMLRLAVGTVDRAVRHTVRSAASVTNPGEILLPRNGPGFEILLVLGNTGERHSGRVVVLPGLVAGLLSRPERSSGLRTVCVRLRGAGGTQVRGWAVIPECALRGANLLGDGAHLLFADVRIVLDGERDGEVRFVELVPKTSQAAHSADARPSHTPLNWQTCGGEKKKKKKKERNQIKEEQKPAQRSKVTFTQSIALPPRPVLGCWEFSASNSPCQQQRSASRDEPVCRGPSINIPLTWSVVPPLCRGICGKLFSASPTGSRASARLTGSKSSETSPFFSTTCIHSCD